METEKKNSPREFCSHKQMVLKAASGRSPFTRRQTGAQKLSKKSRKKAEKASLSRELGRRKCRSSSKRKV